MWRLCGMRLWLVKVLLAWWLRPIDLRRPEG